MMSKINPKNNLQHTIIYSFCFNRFLLRIIPAKFYIDCLVSVLSQSYFSIFLTEVIGFCVCILVQSEPSHVKFLRRLSVSVRFTFCCG